MSHRVKKYLLNLNVITNEDELRELSLNSEPPPGSGMKLTLVKRVVKRLSIHHWLSVQNSRFLFLNSLVRIFISSLAPSSIQLKKKATPPNSPGENRVAKEGMRRTRL